MSEKRSYEKRAYPAKKREYPAGERAREQKGNRSSGRPEGGRPASANHQQRSFHGTRNDGPVRPPSFGKPSMGKPAPRGEGTPSVTSRKVALQAFRDVVRGDAYAALSLDDRLSRVNLPQLDKRFCASIVYRSIENLIRIDYALSFFLKDAESVEPVVLDILRISACQMLFHDRIPDNAIVDEAVKLTRAMGFEGLTGLTNAVLRNMARDKDTIKWPSPDEGARYLSIMYSVPMWLAEELLQVYGPSEAREICAYRNAAHFTSIRPNLAMTTDEGLEQVLQKKVWQVERGPVPHSFRVRQASEIARDADFLRGLFSIQGESSMLAAQAADARPGMQALDCCAAPGGKTAYLAEAMQGTGRVYAWDVHEHRVALIRAMMKRLHLENIRPAVRDAAQPREELFSTMDVVLLDAPCSGLGVMDNKPDIKLRATRESVRELAELQARLLDTCCQYVRRGGALVYSTCSLLPEENTLQIEKFLQNHPEFEIAPLPASIPEPFRVKYGAAGLQLLPHRDGVEGFFIARMRRSK